MMKNVTDYLLKNDLAKMLKKGRRELKSIIINNQKIRYNKDKPLSNKFQKKLKSVKNTNEYRSYANNNKLSLSLGMKEALTRYATFKKNEFKKE